ncbi:MAG: hypothetical protein F6K19_26870 [Cyanothece sp. SIO1E1]|nr:hypothetical protein [Cyanothece sp. SIO1E1]
MAIAHMPVLIRVMGNLSNFQSKQRSLVWRILYHPLALISLGLHAVLLLTPLPSEIELLPTTDDIVATEPEEPIEVLSLAELFPPAPEPLPVPIEPPLEQFQPPAPITQPEPTTVASEPITPTDPSAADAATVESTTAATPPADAVDYSGQFLDALLVLSNRKGEARVTVYPKELGIPGPKLFQSPDNLSFFFTSESIAAQSLATLPDVQETLWIDKQPDTLLARHFGPLFKEQGFTYQEDVYGGEVFLEGRTAAEEPILYLSMVEIKTGSTVLVLWQDDPR